MRSTRSARPPMAAMSWAASGFSATSPPPSAAAPGAAALAARPRDQQTTGRIVYFEEHTRWVKTWSVPGFALILLSNMDREMEKRTVRPFWKYGGTYEIEKKYRCLYKIANLSLKLTFLIGALLLLVSNIHESLAKIYGTYVLSFSVIFLIMIRLFVVLFSRQTDVSKYSVRLTEDDQDRTIRCSKLLFIREAACFCRLVH